MKEKIYAVVSKGDDMELHVKLQKLDAGTCYVTVRDYIPSTKKYGRGVTFQFEQTPEIVTGLERLYMEEQTERDRRERRRK